MPADGGGPAGGDMCGRGSNRVRRRASAGARLASSAGPRLASRAAGDAGPRQPLASRVVRGRASARRRRAAAQGLDRCSFRVAVGGQRRSTARGRRSASGRGSCLPAAAGAAGGRNASAGLDERLGGARRGEFVCRLGLAQAPVAV